MSANLPALAYAGAVIHERGEMLSLTDMWKAVGSPETKRPAHWGRTDIGRQFIEFVAASFKLADPQVWEARRGRHAGGTWAHWQIALAYAKFLSPAFHAWCNTVVRERMEGGARQAAALPVSLSGRTLDEQLDAILAKRGLLNRSGMTADQIWKDHGFEACRLVGWFSRKLRDAGCQMPGNARAELGDMTRLLFDPDLAGQWLASGGRSLVLRKIAERNGQGVLRLVVD